MGRTASVERKTAETYIKACFEIDGSGVASIKTGIGFFDHMLVLFSKHGLFNLDLHAEGDLDVDCHHTVEDAGIVLGQAIDRALTDKKGIKRYGTAFVPMDEALVMVSLDISGRPYLAYDVNIPNAHIGDYDSEMTEEFLRALAVHAGITLHVRLMAGKNSHHIVEAVFKALGRALEEATRIDGRITGVMSSKGVL